MEYFALLLFVISTSITPGPNNLMIMASGANHGMRRSLPHLAGIEVGFPAMLIAVGLGMGELFDRSPLLFQYLKLFGAIYLLYMAWHIAAAPVEKLESKKRKPFSFWQAVLFQWVNPKAWIMCVGAITTFASAGEQYLSDIFMIALIFLVVGTPCSFSWLSLGRSLQRWLSVDNRLRLFNIVMALLLFGSLVPVLIELAEWIFA